VIVVSNTSPITNLAAIERLNLLQALYGTIIIPQAVYDEMASVGYAVLGAIEVQTLSWIETRQVMDTNRVTELLAELDQGEAEAIILALELKADFLLLDERRGRKVATRLGVKRIGLLGVLLEAKQKKLISTVKPVIDELITQVDFRVSSELYSEVIKSAGE